MDEGGLELRLDGIQDIESDNGLRAYIFTAIYEGLTVVEMCVDRLEKPSDPYIIYDSFFMDWDISPPKPKPYVFCIIENEGYTWLGATEKLVEFANKYFKTRFDVPLYSGSLEDGSDIREIETWEMLTESGKASVHEYEGKIRWVMI